MARGKKPATDWKNVDWEQKTGELAKKYGVTTRTVSENRMKYGQRRVPRDKTIVASVETYLYEMIVEERNTKNMTISDIIRDSLLRRYHGFSARA